MSGDPGDPKPLVESAGVVEGSRERQIAKNKTTRTGRDNMQDCASSVNMRMTLGMAGDGELDALFEQAFGRRGQRIS